MCLRFRCHNSEYIMFTSLSIVTVRNSSCGKLMFSQACVKNSIYWETRLTRPPWADTLPRQTPLPGQTPPMDRHSIPGRYPLPLGRHAPGQTPPPRQPLRRTVINSYWNAFLFFFSQNFSFPFHYWQKRECLKIRTLNAQMNFILRGMFSHFKFVTAY